MEYEDEDVHLKSRIVNFALVGERIREKEKTKRLLIIVVFLLFIFSGLSFLFAPEGRELTANIIGAALLVLALGAIGVLKFALRLPGVEVKAEGKLAEEVGQDDDSYLGAEEEVWPVPGTPHKSSDKMDAGNSK